MNAHALCSANKLQVPSQQAGILVLQRLLAGCRLAAQAVPAAHAAAAQLLAQLSMTYFMPFSLTALAMVARIQVQQCCYVLTMVVLESIVLICHCPRPDCS